MAGTTKKQAGKKTAVKRSAGSPLRATAAKKRSIGGTTAKKAASKSATKSRAVTKSAPAAVPPPTGERAIAESTRRMVATAVAACEEKKAEDTRILELDPVDAGFTDFFLITSGTNERQTQSIADEIELRLKREFGTYPNSVEGKRQGEWILLDYVDFVVHVFLAEKRAFYDIERLRKSARTVEAAELQSTLKKKTVAARKKASPRTTPDSTTD